MAKVERFAINSLTKQLLWVWLGYLFVRQADLMVLWCVYSQVAKADLITVHQLK